VASAPHAISFENLLSDLIMFSFPLLVL